MSQYETLYVDKVNRTFADNLLAFGLATLLRDVATDRVNPPLDVVIRDCGAYYELRCSPGLDEALINSLGRRLCPIRAIRTVKNAGLLPEGIPYTDYEQDREQVNQYFAALNKKVERDQLPPLPPNWDISRAINPAALPGYNALVINWWSLAERQVEALRLLLDLYASTPNDYPAAVAAWKQLDKAHGWGIEAESTCLQLYNPDQGKGQNSGKASGLRIGNVEGFWLAEWLKAVGFYDAALTRLVRGAKDRKTFVVAPRELSHSANSKIMTDFRGTMASETSTRFDILAAVRYTRALLRYLSSDESYLQRLFQQRNVKKRVVAGFDTAFYKDLGNAVATMNVSFIALPGWVNVETRADVALYNEDQVGLLPQLERLTWQLDESHSDAFTLLQYLRDFVSGDDLTAFFRFTNAFPAYYMGRRERGQYAYRLTTQFIERLVMSTEKRLSPILECEGFQNVAYAIRQSTVTAQFRKQQGDRRYDVRYGLGQELARKARYPDDFAAALCDFLQKYNAENAQVMETRPGPYRRSVKTTDIDDVIQLIDEYGSETVANLLIAYGYARAPYEGGDNADNDVSENTQPEEETEA